MIIYVGLKRSQGVHQRISVRRQEQCAFCHLCEPGERKRRKKERRMARREAQETLLRLFIRLLLPFSFLKEAGGMSEQPRFHFALER